jgi:glycine/D-amino acid oxidase-like deaminating enzyme
MSPPVDPVVSDSKLPSRADVVVIGGGIVGVSAALALAEKGISVALCEKGRIGAEQSSRNWGWCRTMGRDPREIPLSIEALRMWRGMNARVGAETGFREAGIVYLCENRKDIDRHEAWLEKARLYQVSSRMLGPDEIASVLPGAARPFPAALYTPTDGRAEPAKAAPAIAEAARRRGAAILTECAVRGLEMRGGRVAGVVTEKGRIDCGAAVLAGGAWSRLFCGNSGLDLPQLKVLGSVARTAPLSGPPETAAAASDFAFRKRLDGGYSVSQRASVADIVPDSFRLFFDFLPAMRTTWRDLRFRVGRRFVEEWHVPRRWTLDARSPFEAVRVLDPVPAVNIIGGAQSNLARAFPAFAEMVIAERWGGLIDVTPDAVPVIAPVAAAPGFYLATGFSGHGFGIAPAAGRLMADLVAGDAPIVDPAPFRFERFGRREERAAA